jgi:DNA-binding SARP family transcriptional activator
VHAPTDPALVRGFPAGHGRPVGQPVVLRLRLLGQPLMWRHDQLVHFKMRKTLAVLAYLATESGLRSREQLAMLLWPTHDITGARKNLRIALTYLNQALGEGFLTASQEMVGLDPSALSRLDLDLQTLAQALRLARTVTGQEAPGLRAQLEQAAALYRGPFLEGLDLPDVPEFESWVMGQRAHWLAVAAEVLERLAAVQAEAGELGVAQATLERWVALEPGEERAWHRLLALALDRGDLVGARRLWATCQAALAELDVAPGTALTTLAANIDTPLGAGPTPSPARGTGDPACSVATLPMVGRAGPLAALRQAFACAQAGQTQVLVLQGEAGIGKTRLASEFLSWARAQSADVLTGRAFPAEGSLPYAPMVAALRPRLERENAPEDLLGDLWLAELAHLVPELRERYPDLLPVTTEAALGQGRLFEAVARLGEALAARSPLVLFLDDVQWTDVGTRDVVRYAVRHWAVSGSRTLLLLAVRAEDVGLQGALAQWLGGLEREAATTRLELERLAPWDVVQLVAALAGEPLEEGMYPREVIAWGHWLAEQTGGQPFFVIQTLQTLLDEGTLRLRRLAGGSWVLDVAALAGPVGAGPGGAVVPAAVRALVLAQVAQLEETAQDLLAVATVLGGAFRAEWAVWIAGIDDRSGERALDQLVRRRLLHEVPETGAFRVSDDLVREVVYAELGPARRRRLHRSALALLEAEGVPAAELTRHAVAVGPQGPDVPHTVAAGTSALKILPLSNALAQRERSRAQADASGTR